MPKHQQSDQYALPNHFGWIDGLRGVAAVAVVIFHYHHFYLADYADRESIPPYKASHGILFLVFFTNMGHRQYNCSGSFQGLFLHMFTWIAVPNFETLSLLGLLVYIHFTLQHS